MGQPFLGLLCGWSYYLGDFYVVLFNEMSGENLSLLILLSGGLLTDVYCITCVIITQDEAKSEEEKLAEKMKLMDEETTNPSSSETIDWNVFMADVFKGQEIKQSSFSPELVRDLITQHYDSLPSSNV